jgi:ferritin-like metal-binding protein YciE
MTSPRRYLIRMLVFLLLVAGVVAALQAELWPAFLTNPVLNGVILLVALFGVGWNLRQVLLLGPEVAWLEGFRAAPGTPPTGPAPRLLGPLARMLAGRQGDRFSLSAPAMRSVLDGLSAALDEGREISRYITGLLIFLGLLGTFWGLLLTIGSVADVIGGMSVGTGDLGQLFSQLKSGLAQPLKGMGTAFSSSMLGLASALVLGFLDLTAGQAQNRFYGESEEWLAGQTRLASGILGEGGGEGGSVPAYVQALLEQTAENLEKLQRILTRGEDDRAATNQALGTLVDKLGVLAEQTRANQGLMLRIAEQQAALAPALQALAGAAASPALDEASRQHLRNADQQLGRLIEEVRRGRTQLLDELRSEIKLVARTIAGRGEEGGR